VKLATIVPSVYFQTRVLEYLQVTRFNWYSILFCFTERFQTTVYITYYAPTPNMLTNMEYTGSGFNRFI